MTDRLPILILDDNADTADGLRRLFGVLCNLEVATARTIAEADAIIDAREPEGAVIDRGLPDGDGLDFLRRLMARYPACRAIVGTGYADEEVVAESLAAGATAVLTKPLSVEKVKAALGLPASP